MHGDDPGSPSDEHNTSSPLRELPQGEVLHCANEKQNGSPQRRTVSVFSEGITHLVRIQREAVS